MITWLASYPKSGNTWFRALLTNYQRNDDSPADINALDGGPIASTRIWFDEWCGIEASLLSDIVIERLRPAVYRCLARENPQPLYMKTHDAWKRTDTGEPLFPPDITAGVVYLIRNPLDVTISWANHRGISVEKSLEDLCNPDFCISRRFDGLADQLAQYLGSWSNHVRSWVDESRLPIHIIRYEDLRREPESIFREALHFLDIPLETERIKKAVAFSSFGELQKQEHAKGFRERPVHASSGFFRQGKNGDWRTKLSPEQIRRLVRVHAETMHRFGYLDDALLSYQ
jgi:aryl sulfotransferase